MYIMLSKPAPRWCVFGVSLHTSQRKRACEFSQALDFIHFVLVGDAGFEPATPAV
jgi:hypothetical protein